MRRGLAVAIAVLVVLAPVTAATSIGVLSPSESLERHLSDLSTFETEHNRSGMAPGAQFVGVIGAHENRHAGAVAEWRVKVRIAAGDTRTERAEILATIYRETRARLEALEDRLQHLGQALANGSITRSEYRVRRAALTVELRTVERIAAYLEQRGHELGLSLLPTVSVTIQDLEALQARAEALQGGVLASIAPSFGLDNGDGTADAGDDETTDGTGETVTNTTNVTTVVNEAESTVETARDRVEEAETTLSGLVVSDSTATLLDQAQYNLSVAEQRLAAAREAKAAGNEARAIELARDAIYRANLAIEQAEAAIEAATTT